jgi:hypothetical protein
LTGTLPTEIGNLQKLGQYPSGHQLSKLYKTNSFPCLSGTAGFERNSFIGPIPTEFGNIQALSESLRRGCRRLLHISLMC